MQSLLTPDQVIQELLRIQSESSKAPQAIYEANVAVIEAERAYKHKWNLEFIAVKGTIQDRKAIADLACEDLEDAYELAKANLDRVKTKAKQLADAGVLVSVMGRQVELAMR